MITFGVLTEKKVVKINTFSSHITDTNCDLIKICLSWVYLFLPGYPNWAANKPAWGGEAE